MPKQSQRQQTKSPELCVGQIPIAFPTKGTLEPNERREVVVLLSRLLLQVANHENEVCDDHS